MRQLFDRGFRPLSISRREFRSAFYREPRIAGNLDAEQADEIASRGGQCVSVTCLGDDIESYVLARAPGRQE